MVHSEFVTLFFWGVCTGCSLWPDVSGSGNNCINTSRGAANGGFADTGSSREFEDPVSAHVRIQQVQAFLGSLSRDPDTATLLSVAVGLLVMHDLAELSSANGLWTNDQTAFLDAGFLYGADAATLSEATPYVQFDYTLYDEFSMQYEPGEFVGVCDCATFSGDVVPSHRMSKEDVRLFSAHHPELRELNPCHILSNSYLASCAVSDAYFTGLNEYVSVMNDGQMPLTYEYKGVAQPYAYVNTDRLLLRESDYMTLHPSIGDHIGTFGVFAVFFREHNTRAWPAGVTLQDATLSMRHTWQRIVAEEWAPVALHPTHLARIQRPYVYDPGMAVSTSVFVELLVKPYLDARWDDDFMVRHPVTGSLMEKRHGDVISNRHGTGVPLVHADRHVPYAGFLRVGTPSEGVVRLLAERHALLLANGVPGVVASLSAGQVATRPRLPAPLVNAEWHPRAGNATVVDTLGRALRLGRLAGVPPYSEVRARFHPEGGLTRSPRCPHLEHSGCFDVLTSHPESAAFLRKTFGTVREVDALLGLLFEDTEGRLLPPTLSGVVAEALEAARSGDRFWYEGEDGAVDAGDRFGDLVGRHLPALHGSLVGFQRQVPTTTTPPSSEESTAGEDPTLVPAPVGLSIQVLYLVVGLMILLVVCKTFAVCVCGWVRVRTLIAHQHSTLANGGFENRDHRHALSRENTFTVSVAEPSDLFEDVMQAPSSPSIPNSESLQALQPLERPQSPERTPRTNRRVLLERFKAHVGTVSALSLSELNEARTSGTGDRVATKVH